MGKVLQNTSRKNKKSTGRKPTPEPRYEYRIDDTETDALDKIFAELFRKAEQEINGDPL